MLADIKFYWRKTGTLFFLNWGFIMLAHYRLGRWAFTSGFRQVNPFWYLYLIIKFFLLMVCKIELPPTAKIGKNLYLPHPYGLVMGGKTVIGDDCTIGPWVVIGHLRKDGNPVVGNRVYIGPKASVLGNIHIGDDTVIGAHALVVESLAPNSKVLGTKGTIKHEA